MNRSDIRSRIKAVLDAAGLSYGKVSERLCRIADEEGLETAGFSTGESVRQWIMPVEDGKTAPIPSAVALYCLARYTGRPMQWFIDGQEEGPSRDSLTDDERFVLRTWRIQRIDADEAARRLASGG